MERAGEGVGGGEEVTAPPRDQNTYPFIYHFSPKWYPFRIPRIKTLYPFST